MSLSSFSTQLYKSKQTGMKHTRRLVQKLIRLTIETGTLTGKPHYIFSSFYKVLTRADNAISDHRHHQPVDTQPPKRARYVLRNSRFDRVNCSSFKGVREHDAGAGAVE